MVDKGKGVADDSSSWKRKRDGDDKSGNRKRKNPNVLQFFEESAFEIDESGSSDDEDFIDDINMYFEDTLGPDLDVKTEPKTPNIPFLPKEEEMDEEEMEKMLEARYKPGAGFVKHAEDRPGFARTNERDPFIPSAKDPIIWKVKCMVGRERHSVFCLMQKFVDLKSLGNKLQIVSAFAVDHVKGFIYIEAEKQCDINEACKGLCNIYPSRVAPVPEHEVSHLFSVRSKYSGVKVDTWARVKAGHYKGDLARVVNVNEAKRKATVKLVPRIDLQALSEKIGGGVTGKKATIPAPRLITSSELEAYRPLVQVRRDRDTGDMYEVFDGMCLKDGYLFKKVPLDSLSYWDVRPSEAELLKFSPANKEESNDVEWLTGLFGERKKKKPTINNNKGGKGEGSSSSSMENSFEVPDLVFHGRKAFGVVIGREKDDRIKVLEEGTGKPMVVAVEARLLKKADFDKKFTAFDQHKKIISTNDLVRILEGPLEDKTGIVKQIYKGVIFLHDERETENCGYYCAKAQICEKMESSADLFKGKGGKSDASGFDGFPASPKSPLSPEKAFEVTESSRNVDQDDSEGFSVGKSCRIRVGPLKGYMCRVMAIRYSDITVKLDSQHKILTVKAEHLVEVKGKSSVVSTGDGQDSAKPFELLGDHGGSQGWMDGATESGGWAPFGAAGSSVDNVVGWGASSSGVKNDNSEDGGGWGAAKKVEDTTATGGWGAAKKEEDTPAATGGWGAAKKDEDTPGGWGAAKKSPASGGWGATKKDEDTPASGGWGDEDTPAGGGGWGAAKKNEDIPAGGGWGATRKDEDAPASGGWGAPKKDEDSPAGGGWGAAKTDDITASGGGWGAPKKNEDTTSGWGASGGCSWAEKDEGGGRSFPQGGGRSCYKCGESGHMSRECPKGGGGGGGACFKCGEMGHMSRECPQGGGGGSRNCYKCGEAGHMSRECPQGGGGGGGGNGNCFKCGESGHMSRECPQGGGGRNCYKCGESGHMSRECPQGGGGGGGKCFKCGESGHMSRECPQGGGGGGNRNCFKCGESGHMSRECPQGGGGGGSRSCYKCGESGHMSRECPQGGGGGRNCYKCGESGHMSRECPQGGGGGGGGWSSGGWSSGNQTGGGWGSDAAAVEKKDDAQGSQWGSGGGGQTAGGWGSSDGGKKASGWGGSGDQSAPEKKEGWGGSSGGGWGSDAKKDDGEGSGGKKSGW